MLYYALLTVFLAQLNAAVTPSPCDPSLVLGNWRVARIFIDGNGKIAGRSPNGDKFTGVCSGANEWTVSFFADSSADAVGTVSADGRKITWADSARPAWQRLFVPARCASTIVGQWTTSSPTPATATFSVAGALLWGSITGQSDFLGYCVYVPREIDPATEVQVDEESEVFEFDLQEGGVKTAMIQEGIIVFTDETTPWKTGPAGSPSVIAPPSSTDTVAPSVDLADVLSNANL